MKKHLMFLAAFILSFIAVPALHAQVTPKTLTTLTLSDTSIATSATETVTSQAFTINPDSGFAVIATFVGSTTGTSNVTFNFQVSTDGTTWSTNTPFTFAVAATGATTVRAFYNFPPGVAGTGASNIAYVRLASVANANSGATITLNSVVISRNN